MISAIFSSLLLWISFIVFSAAAVFVAIVVAYYGLKLLNYLEQWYKSGKD